MKKTFRKVLSIAIACVMLAAMFAIGSNAAPGDIKYTIKGTTTPTTLDGAIGEGEYAGNDPIVLDGSGKNTEGDGWVGTWAGQVYKFYYTWDADYLYVGITVEGDTTPFHDYDMNAIDWFGNADEVQMGFNPNYEIEGAMPVVISIGFTSDAPAYLNADAYGAIADDGSQEHVILNFPSFSKAYSADGINYCAEAHIPWSNIFVKGNGRSSDGAPFYDFSGMKAEEGVEIGLWYACMDDGNGEGADWSMDNGYRTDITTGAGWVAEEMSSIAIVLADADVVDAPVVDDTPVDTDAAQTFDGIIVVAAIAAISAAGVVVSKKSK